MKKKRLATITAMMISMVISMGVLTYASTLKQTNLTTSDGKTTAQGTITSEYHFFTKDGGGAATVIDADSKIYSRRVFTAIFALNKNGGIVNSKTKTSDFYNEVVITANCKSFKSYHQIMDVNGKPLATRKSLTA